MKSNEIERSLDNLFGTESIKTLSRQRVVHEFERLVASVETVASHSVLMSLRSTEQVAELHGVSRQSINARATRIRDKRGSFGWKAGRGVWVFLPEEVEELRPGKTGRPPSTT